MNRFLRLCIASCLVLTACGGNNEENNATTNNTATNNTSTNNTATNNTATNNTATNNNVTVSQCNATNDACDPALPTNMGFVCIDDTCQQECDPNSEQSDCRAGSLCSALSDAGPYFCIPSDCNGLLDDSCPAGQQCIAYINETDLCTQVGTKALGEACTSTNTDPFQCAPGLYCIFGECAEICGADTDCDTAAGERCVTDTLDSGVGFCDVGCDSYSLGQCPDGQGCFPVTEVDGVCEDVGTVGPWNACDDDNECGEGSACILFQSADAATGAQEQSRCLPFCNPIPETAPERDATCPQPGGNPMGYGRFVHLTEGAGMVDIYVDGTLTVDDLAFEGVSSAGAFLPLTVGAHAVDITAFDAADNSAPILTVNPNITASTVSTWGIIPDATTTVAIITVPEARGEAAPTAGSSKLRPVHAIPDFGAVDVVAVPAGAVDFTAEVELAINLAAGATAASYTEVPAGSYDVYLFPTGGARDTANAAGVTVAGVAIAADLTLSVYARGTADTADGADPGLTTVAYRSAPAQSGALGGFCLDLSGDTPVANGGFCIEKCPSSDTFGTGACSTDGDVCTPLRGGVGCFPGGPNGPGDACNPDVLEEGCDGVSFCEPRGDGTGECSSYCQPTTQSNGLLGCEATQECVDAGNNLGYCSTTCTPGADYSDTTSCPAGLQTCIPEDDGAAYCAASGAVAVGGACAVFAGTCMPGDTCANEWTLTAEGPTDDIYLDGTCADSCALFGDNSDCGAGQVCMVSFFTLSQEVGICATPTADLAPAAPCTAGTVVCGDHASCADIGRGLECVHWCDLDDSTTCPANTACTAAFNSADIRIGVCQ